MRTGFIERGRTLKTPGQAAGAILARMEKVVHSVSVVVLTADGLALGGVASLDRKSAVLASWPMGIQRHSGKSLPPRECSCQSGPPNDRDSSTPDRRQLYEQLSRLLKVKATSVVRDRESTARPNLHEF
jgi:hypothetical protein